MLSWLQDWLPGNRQDDVPSHRAQTIGRAAGYVEPYPQSDETRAGELGHEQKASVQNTAFRVSRLILDGATTFEICDIIRRCPHKHQLLSERDFYGYNALQYAVICARQDLMVEMIRFGADINLPICGRPLHLACKLGHAEIVATLLKHGADPQVVACVCYPYHHTKAGFTYSDKREKWSLSCIGDVFSSEHGSDILFDFPLYYALLSHSVECVQILLNRQFSQASFLRHGHPLHLVCEIGAMNVLQFLCQLSKKIPKLQHAQLGQDDLNRLYSQEVNIKDSNIHLSPESYQRSLHHANDFHMELNLNKSDSHGYTPLHYAVRWGRAIVEYLVLHGAHVQIKTRSEQTVLHVLYSGATERWVNAIGSKKSHKQLCSSSLQKSVHDSRNGIPAELPRGMVQCTRYLLSCGLQMYINALDSNGNSALHCLVSLVHLNLCGKDGVRCEERQSLWINTVQECVLAMLQSHINPNIPNKNGDTCLHVLLTKPTAEKPSTDAQEEVSTNRFFYNIPGIVPILAELLKHGAKPNMVNNKESTGIELLLRESVECVFGQVPGKWRSPDKSEVTSLIQCLRLLCRHGYHFDNPVQGQIHLQLILNQITKIDHLASFPSHGIEFTAAHQRELVTEYVSAVLEVTQALLECGCNPNTVRPVKHTEGLVHQCNSLHVAYYLLMNRQAAVPLNIVHRCMLLLLQFGVDPNRDGEHVPLSVIHPYGYEVRTVFPLLHVLNVIGSPFKTHSTENRVHLRKLFEVLYNSMDDRVSRQCVQHYLNYDRLHMCRLWVPHAHRLVFGFYDVNEDDDDGHIDGAGGGNQGHLGQPVAVQENEECLDKLADFNNQLDVLLHNTRSLKHLSRLAVVKMLNRKLLHIQEIPLPTTLKTYVLTFCS